MRVIIDFLRNFVDWIVSAFSAFYQFLVDLIVSVYRSVLEYLIDLIPDFSPMWQYLEPVRPYTAFINKWIALDTAASLLVVYFLFITTMIAVKLIIKLFVPTVG